VKSHADARILLQPPLDRWSPMDFTAFDEIRQVARDYAASLLAHVDVAALVEDAPSAGE
jgi:hypothetical protein